MRKIKNVKTITIWFLTLLLMLSSVVITCSKKTSEGGQELQSKGGGIDTGNPIGTRPIDKLEPVNEVAPSNSKNEMVAFNLVAVDNTPKETSANLVKPIAKTSNSPFNLVSDSPSEIVLANGLHIISAKINISAIKLKAPLEPADDEVKFMTQYLDIEEDILVDFNFPQYQVPTNTKDIEQQLEQIEKQADQMDAQFEQQEAQLEQFEAQQDAQLEQQETLLDQQEAQLEQQEAQLEQQEAQLDQQEAQLDQQGAQSEQQEAQLEQQREELARQGMQLEQQGEEIAQQGEEIEHSAEQFEKQIEQFMQQIEDDMRAQQQHLQTIMDNLEAMLEQRVYRLDKEQELDPSTKFVGPYVLDLLGNQLNPPLEKVMVRNGTYQRVEFRMERHLSDDKNDPLFGNTFMIQGYFINPNGQKVLFSIVDYHTEVLRLTSKEGMTLTKDSEQLFRLSFDLNSWFAGIDLTGINAVNELVHISSDKNAEVLKKLKDNMKQNVSLDQQTDAQKDIFSEIGKGILFNN